MPLFAGPVLLPREAQDGWLVAEDGHIVECGLGEAPERADGRGWIVPMPVNAHTHAGDTFLRDCPGKPDDLGALVGPGGWKHQGLARASPEDLQGGIARLTGEAAAVGTSRILDFREQGVDGLRAAQGEWPVPVSWYGRPGAYTFDEDEAAAVLAIADGVGLSAVRDFPRYRDVEHWADACRDADRPLALHASEGRREDIHAILQLGPAFLVHGCTMTRGDLDAVADEGVPLVVCPRSNRRFGLRAPVPAMLEAGIQVGLGTDNGMLQDGDIWAEAAQARALWDLSEEQVLRMATYGGHAAAGTPAPRFAPGPADWLVLPALPTAPTGKPIIAPRDAGA